MTRDGASNKRGGVGEAQKQPICGSFPLKNGCSSGKWSFSIAPPGLLLLL
jgi:hypothetical protein